MKRSEQDENNVLNGVYVDNIHFWSHPLEPTKIRYYYTGDRRCPSDHDHTNVDWISVGPSREREVISSLIPDSINHCLYVNHSWVIEPTNKDHIEWVLSRKEETADDTPSFVDADICIAPEPEPDLWVSVYEWPVSFRVWCAFRLGERFRRMSEYARSLGLRWSGKQ